MSNPPKQPPLTPCQQEQNLLQKLKSLSISLYHARLIKLLDSLRHNESFEGLSISNRRKLISKLFMEGGFKGLDVQLYIDADDVDKLGLEVAEFEDDILTPDDNDWD